jgi:hypothetical protein
MSYQKVLEIQAEAEAALNALGAYPCAPRNASHMEMAYAQWHGRDYDAKSNRIHAQSYQRYAEIGGLVREDGSIERTAEECRAIAQDFWKRSGGAGPLPTWD